MYDIEVTVDGETHTYAVSPKVIFAFEEHFKIGFIQALTKEQRMQHVYWIGWECSRSAGVVVKPFTQWLDSLQRCKLVLGKDDDQET